MTKLLYYRVCWRLGGCKLFLLWCYRNNGNNGGPSCYILREYDKKLLVTQTEEEIVDYANEQGFQVSDEPINFIDFDALDTVLSGLRPGRSISENSANLLITAWNALDDVSNSIGKDRCFESLIGTEEVVNKLYEKLFYGLNLPPVTPEGKKYSPLLDAQEREILRKLFKYAKKELLGLL